MPVRHCLSFSTQTYAWSVVQDPTQRKKYFVLNVKRSPVQLPCTYTLKMNLLDILKGG